MCFSSIFSWKLRIIPYLCEIDVRTLPPFGPHKKNLVSIAAEWIVLSFDTPYYTELPHILQNRDWKLGHMSYVPVVAPFCVTCKA